LTRPTETHRAGRGLRCGAHGVSKNFVEPPSAISGLTLWGWLLWGWLDESAAVRSLLVRYGPQMDYADACIVRLSELNREHRIVTTDAADFRMYRRFGRQALEMRVP
jgi:hypothetical protein